MSLPVLQVTPPQLLNYWTNLAQTLCNVCYLTSIDHFGQSLTLHTFHSARPFSVAYCPSLSLTDPFALHKFLELVHLPFQLTPWAFFMSLVSTPLILGLCVFSSIQVSFSYITPAITVLSLNYFCSLVLTIVLLVTAYNVKELLLWYALSFSSSRRLPS